MSERASEQAHTRASIHRVRDTQEHRAIGEVGFFSPGTGVIRHSGTIVHRYNGEISLQSGLLRRSPEIEFVVLQFRYTELLMYRREALLEQFNRISHRRKCRRCVAQRAFRRDFGRIIFRAGRARSTL